MYRSVQFAICSNHRFRADRDFASWSTSLNNPSLCQLTRTNVDESAIRTYISILPHDNIESLALHQLIHEAQSHKTYIFTGEVTHDPTRLADPHKIPISSHPLDLIELEVALVVPNDGQIT